MPWMIEVLFVKYRDTILNDQKSYEIKRRYKLSSDNYAILNNKIIEYQKNKYGDILYNTGYEFYNQEELAEISHKAYLRKKARRERRYAIKD